MRLNRGLAGAGLWALSVITVAGLAWFAIDSAGRSVSGSQNLTVVAANADGSGGSQTGTGSSTGPGRSTIGLATGPDGSTTPSAAATTTSPPAPQRPASQPVSRTYSGSGGRVTVTCTGSIASLESASPSSGWSMTVEEAGPQEVEVQFGHGSDSALTVQGRCVAGAPVFTATTGEPTEDEGGSGKGSNGSGGSGAVSSGSGGDG
jgi:hypothetical protein